MSLDQTAPALKYICWSGIRRLNERRSTKIMEMLYIFGKKFLLRSNQINSNSGMIAPPLSKSTIQFTTQRRSWASYPSAVFWGRYAATQWLLERLLLNLYCLERLWTVSNKQWSAYCDSKVGIPIIMEKGSKASSASAFGSITFGVGARGTPLLHAFRQLLLLF